MNLASVPLISDTRHSTMRSRGLVFLAFGVESQVGRAALGPLLANSIARARHLRAPAPPGHGPSRIRRLKRPRISGTALRAAPRPGHVSASILERIKHIGARHQHNERTQLVLDLDRAVM